MTTTLQKTSTLDSIRAWFGARGFVRVRRGRVFGGVLAGIGEKLGMEPWPTRLLFIALLMLIPGSQVIAYPVLWVLMPAQRDAASG